MPAPACPAFDFLFKFPRPAGPGGHSSRLPVVAQLAVLPPLRKLRGTVEYRHCAETVPQWAVLPPLRKFGGTVEYRHRGAHFLQTKVDRFELWQTVNRPWTAQLRRTERARLLVIACFHEGTWHAYR